MLFVFVACSDDDDSGTDNPPTTDTTNPTVSSLSPADGATGVATNANLVITFNETVVAKTGNISLYKTGVATPIEQFDVTTDISGSGTTTITTNPTSDLEAEMDYYVQIDATAFADNAGNSFAGISGATGWAFTTAGGIREILLPTPAMAQCTKR